MSTHTNQRFVTHKTTRGINLRDTIDVGKNTKTNRGTVQKRDGSRHPPLRRPKE